MRGPQKLHDPLANQAEHLVEIQGSRQAVGNLVEAPRLSGRPPAGFVQPGVLDGNGGVCAQ